MEIPKEISKPLNHQGLPNKWLTILIPFLKKEECTKKEILKLFGVDESNWKTRRNCCNKHLTAMVQAGVLETENKGPATKWRRGPNFMLFVGGLMIEIAQKHKSKADLINLFYKGEDDNSLDFMKRLILED